MPVRASRPSRRLGVTALAALAALASGCGSAAVAELPPPAGPREAPPLTAEPEGRVLPGGVPADRAATPAGTTAEVDDGAKVAVVRSRERVVELFTAGFGERLGRVDAGVGPTNAIANGRWLWVADTRGDALLVFRTRPELELVRRVYLPRGPYALALDGEKRRLWVTLTGSNEVAELPAHGRPSELRRFPTVRQPDAVAVDPATGEVVVGGSDARQRFDPPPLER